jgi:hypothetical protein
MIMDDVLSRIEKDLRIFDDNIKKVGSIDKRQQKVVELAEMYASDCKAFIKKGDLYTAFSCISYAHGLLDAILKINES